MVKFAHIADCHLGGWKNLKLQELNLQSFKESIDICIKEKVNFVLIAGDLFDSAYPPIEILKETFAIFKKLKEAKIPCYLIAGSHDYSVSGKTFLDVLEKGGFCKNAYKQEIKENKDPNKENKEIILNPIIDNNTAIYGYPGKKSGLEVEELKKIKLQTSPGLFTIFMLHTTINSVKGNIPIESVDENSLPKADYYALGHIHTNFNYENFIYPGPTFPNNFQELHDLKHGSFYIVETSGDKILSLEKKELKLKDVLFIETEITDGFTAKEKIISEIEKKDYEGKIVLLRIKGRLLRGKLSDIKFNDIDSYISKKAFAFLKNTSQLITEEPEIEIKTSNMKEIEKEIIDNYTRENPSKFNNLILQLINTLNIEKQEDEKRTIFQNRLLEETKKIIEIE